MVRSHILETLGKRLPYKVFFCILVSSSATSSHLPLIPSHLSSYLLCTFASLPPKLPCID